MHPRKFSNEQVREMYDYAAQKKISIRHACRNRGLSYNDYEIIRNWGKKLGFKCLTAAELSGHSERDCQLYALIVHGTKKGIYVGSSVNPNLRLKQHITKAKREGETGVNKRDRFMFKAMQENEDCFSFKVFPRKYHASQIPSFETALIKKVQAAFPNVTLLNGLVGAPMGGYGVKLSKEKEREIIKTYLNQRITTERLAEEYGVGRGTINRILQREGATKSRAEMMVRYDDSIRKQVLSDVKAGATDDQITEKYGMSKPTIFKLKKENGLTKFKKAKIANVEVCGTVFPTLKEAADQHGIDYKSARRRIKKLGWSVEQALGIEPRVATPKKGKKVTAFGVEYNSLTQASRAFGISNGLVRARVTSCGWPIEKALSTKVGEAPSVGLNPSPETQRRLNEVKELGYFSLAEAAREYSINVGTVSRRLAKGYSVKEALETPLMNGGAVRWSKRLETVND